MLWRELRSEARRNVGCSEATGNSAGRQEGDDRDSCENGSSSVDWRKQREGSVYQLQQATGCRRLASRAGLGSRRLCSCCFRQAIVEQGWKCSANGVYSVKNRATKRAKKLGSPND